MKMMFQGILKHFAARTAIGEMGRVVRLSSTSRTVMVQNDDRDFFKTLTKKLGWGPSSKSVSRIYEVEFGSGPLILSSFIETQIFELSLVRDSSRPVELRRLFRRV